MEMTLIEQVKEAIDLLVAEKGEFTTQEVIDLLPDRNASSIATCVRRDLVKNKRVIKPIAQRGKTKIYTLIDIPEPKEPEEELKEEPEETKLAQHGIDYIDIGNAIEQLIESKNKQIERLENEIKQLKLENIDKDGMIQERDRHISKQGQKIHELNEQLRKKSGGAIRLDELQDIMKGS
jgi:hypothetical protein